MYWLNLPVTHESALRAYHHASHDIRSLMSPENQMSASHPLGFL